MGIHSAHDVVEAVYKMNLCNRAIKLAKILYNNKSHKIELNTLPIRLWIESSVACNLQCVMCLNKEIPNSDKGIMNFEPFKKIIDESKDFVSDINIHHRGEPLLNPDFIKMIDYAKHNGLSVRFHTTGNLLYQDQVIQILKAQPDLLSISFDGFQKDIYEEI